jgi:hypothetical protein
LDYPGQYMRRIKSVSLTIPCVVGPYTEVHCRLTLLASSTRIVPWLEPGAAPCCKDHPVLPPMPKSPCGCWDEPALPAHSIPKPREHGPGGYVASPADARFVRRYGAKEAIATSTGQRDTGLFELNFRDERYLPFEFEGAISRWRLELPPENNFYEIDTMSDAAIQINYTAREGGEPLRSAARAAAASHLPDSGRRVVEAEHDLPDQWRRFRSLPPTERQREFELLVGRDTFMFLPGRRSVSITGIEIFFETPDAEPGDHHTVEFVLSHRHGCLEPKHRTDDEDDIRCVVSAAWPGVYHGALDIHLGPLRHGERERIGALRFGRSCGTVKNLFIVLRYEAGQRDGLPSHNRKKADPEMAEHAPRGERLRLE